ncbi:MAG: hypothetical protein JXB60_10080, partial [Candidatus Cloacimonetes bacterium]|nr:hypothetical protein [Candidatus Cloacimonadota bacterium]
MNKVAPLCLILLLANSVAYSTSFEGYVFDQDTLLPIPGAVVTGGGLVIDNIYTDTTWVDTTDVNGYFLLDNLLQANDYTINASALGYESADELLEEPPGYYEFYLWKPANGLLVETLNEGLKNYEYNGEYWYRSNGEIFDNSCGTFFYDINAQSDTIAAFMAEIGAGTDYTNDNNMIYTKLVTVWNWLAENSYYALGDSLWLEANQYLLDISGDHYYTIAALATTYYEYGFLPWGTCMSKANILSTILYKTGVDRNRFFIGECRFHLRYSQHMYVVMYLFDRWYHIDPTHYFMDFPSAAEFHSIPDEISGNTDHSHPWNMYLLPESSITDIPHTTRKTRNDVLYIKTPPENTHTLNTAIAVSGYADDSVIQEVNVQGVNYPVIADQFTAIANLSCGENIIQVSSAGRQYSDSVTVIKDFYVNVDFSAIPREGSIPLEVQFQDLTSVPEFYSVSSWEWDLDGDGVTNSYLQNPVYTYQDTGSYDISLKIQMEGAEDIVTRSGYINVFENRLSGHAFLQDTSDHSGIIVSLYHAADEQYMRNVITSLDGYYEFFLNSDEYFLVYEKTGYFPRSSAIVDFEDDIVMPDIILVPESSLILVPDYFSSISAAIDYAVDGDTIRIAAGTYSESIFLGGKNLILESYFPSTQNEYYIVNTIIQAPRDGAVIAILDDEEYVRLEGFTISGGNAQYGGGVYIDLNTPGARVDLYHLRISGNSAEEGGGLFCNLSELYACDLEISNNSAAIAGGGMYLDNVLTIWLENIKCSFNDAGGDGAAIYILGCNQVWMNAVDLVNNTAQNLAGGLYLNNSHLIMDNTLISSNMAGHGVGIYAYLSELNIYNTIIRNNICPLQRGNGGGLYIILTDILLCNCNLVDNYADSYGSALVGHVSSTIDIVNCIFTGNNNCSSIHVFDANTILSATCNNFWNEGNIFSNCNDSLGVITGTNNNGDPCDAFYNIFLEPVFMSPWNHQLFSSSPCINAGIQDTTGLNLPQYDRAGNTRIYADIIDIGAYEFQGITEIASPENIIIETAEGQIRISWDVIYPATSYQIYSSNVAYDSFSLETEGSFTAEDDRIIWTKAL